MIDSAVILAVGLPSHQTQLTYQRPHAMLPALGKPMVVRVMDQLYRAGIRHYFLVVGMNEGAVAGYLNKQWMPDAKIEIILQANTDNFGTTLARITKQVNKPFIAVSYNSFTHEQFISKLINHHRDSPESFIVTGAKLSLSPNAENYYAIMDDERVKQVTRTKPKSGKNFVLSDLVIFGTHIIDHLDDLDSENSGQYGRNLREVTAKYSQSSEALLSIGETSWSLCVESDRDLLTLNKRLLDESNDAHILSELPYTVKIIPPVRIDPQVTVGQAAVIGPHVYIERGSRIGHSSIIKNTLILERSNVPAETEIDGSIFTTQGKLEL